MNMSINPSLRFYAFVMLAALTGGATQGKPPPVISLDEPVQAQFLPEPPVPVEVVTVPEVLPIPAQLKPLPEAEEIKSVPEPIDEKARVSRANAEARIAPTREGYVNAIQVWPYSDGALYQVYAAVGRVTVISLQPGEELVTVAAGDTMRWIVGDTSSGSAADLRVNVLVKPIRSGLKTLEAFDPMAAGPASTAVQPTDPTATQNRQDQKEAFLTGVSTQTRNSGHLQMPASPYQVMAGTDPAGYAGLEDGVDWHWNRIFAGAALTTLLGVGAELVAPENRQDGNRVILAGRDSVQDTVNQIGQEVTRSNLNIQPTLTSRPGLPVRIIVNRDLQLRPYQPLFFNRGISQ